MSVDVDIQAAPGSAADLPVLRLKRGEDRRLRAGHLWVFSNEVDNDATPLTALAVGAMVRVLSDRDQFIGYAYVNPHALICARILSRSPVHPPDRSLLVHRLKVALALRDRLTQLHKDFEIKLFPDKEHSIGSTAGDAAIDFFQRRLLDSMEFDSIVIGIETQ